MYYIVKMLKSGRTDIGTDGMYIDQEARIIGCTESRSEAMKMAQKEAYGKTYKEMLEEMGSGASVIR